MPEPKPSAKTWLITVLTAAVIVYGSFYPFEFRIPPGDPGPLAVFLASIGKPPGRGDALVNLLLYMPLGFFFVLGYRGARQTAGLALATVAAGLLSLGVELAQHYDAGRVTSFTDFIINTLGAFLGGQAAIVLGRSIRLPFIGEVAARPIPSLLIISWLGYRLYPYVPTIDLHKYWNALKPIVLTPSLTGYELFRQTAVWLAVYALIEAIVRRRYSAFLAPLFALAVLGAKVAIVSILLKLADPVGAALAYMIWLLLLLVASDRVRAGAAGVLLCAYVIVWRLEPFTFLPVARDFHWIPFQGLMHGSLQVDALSFLQKFFRYGSMVYLLSIAFGRRLPAAVLVAALLFATSWAETWLPNRSGEITDALIALLAALVFALLPAEHDGASQAAPGLSGRERRLRDWQRAQARALGIEPDRS